jgi:hypothetical protein
MSVICYGGEYEAGAMQVNRLQQWESFVHQAISMVVEFEPLCSKEKKQT